MVDSLTATLEKDLQIVLDKSTEFFLQLMANATENQVKVLSSLDWQI